jgi:hypothetical protein
MKRAAALLLFFVVLCSSALASDAPDPIVGTWYLHYSRDTTPDFSYFDDSCSRLVYIFTFHEKGLVTLLMSKTEDGKTHPYEGLVGTWKNDGEDYLLSLNMDHPVKWYAMLIDGFLFVRPHDSPDHLLRFRPLCTFSPDTDYLQIP